MSNIIELTDYELRMIQEHRAKRAEVKRNERIIVYGVNVAADYSAWLTEHGRGTSLSVFIDEFGYEHDKTLGIKPATVYALVKRILDCATVFVWGGE